MNRRDEQWGQEDDPIVQRLQNEKPQASPLELDRMKTTAMAKAKPSRSRRGMPKSRIAGALLTFGLMAGGTAGTVAATHGSTGSVSAARAEYKPCDHGGKEDRERCRRLYCEKKFKGHGRGDLERCLREGGLVPPPVTKPPPGACDHGGQADRERCRRLYCQKFTVRADQERCLREAGLVPPPPEPTTVPKPVVAPTTPAVHTAPATKTKTKTVVRKRAVKKTAAKKRAAHKKHAVKHAKSSRR